MLFLPPTIVSASNWRSPKIQNRVGSGSRKAQRVGTKPKIPVLMRKVFQFSMMAVICLLLSATATHAVVAIESNRPVDQLLNGTQPGLSVEQFIKLTPNQIKEMTGQKLTFKETLVLKKAQKEIKKSMDSNSAGKPKSQVVALILVIFLGSFGIHRFYLGYTTIGILQILTLGGCGIWTLIDFIRIITGDLVPADGSAYDPAL